jgi:hypothetical protein
VAVTSRQIGFDDYCAGDMPVSRILPMLAGEALRLEAYAASGLIDLDEPVPVDLLNAAYALQAAGFSSWTVNAGSPPSVSPAVSEAGAQR